MMIFQFSKLTVSPVTRLRNVLRHLQAIRRQKESSLSKRLRSPNKSEFLNSFVQLPAVDFRPAVHGMLHESLLELPGHRRMFQNQEAPA